MMEKTITVRYTAGKDGFRILEGDHVPEGANGLNSAAFDPNSAAAQVVQPAPAREAPRAQPPPVRQQQHRPVPVQRQPTPVQRQPAPVQRQFAPVQPAQPAQQAADPTHLNFQHNTNAAQFSGRPVAQPQRVQPQQVQPQRAPVQRAQIPRAQPQVAQPAAPHNGNAVPACADCAGLNPFINPADSSHAQLFAQSQQPAAPSFRQPAQPSFRQPASTFVPQQQS